MGEKHDLDALMKKLPPGVLTVIQDGPVGRSVMYHRQYIRNRDVLEALPPDKRERVEAVLDEIDAFKIDRRPLREQLDERIEAGERLAVSTLEELGLPTTPGRYFRQGGEYVADQPPEEPDTSDVDCDEAWADYETKYDAWEQAVASADDQDWKEVLQAQEGGRASVAWLCKRLLDAAREYRTALNRLDDSFETDRPDPMRSHTALREAHSFDRAFYRLQYAVNDSQHVWRGRKALESAQAGGQARGEDRSAELAPAIADFRAAKKNNPKITRAGWSKKHAHDYGYKPNSLRQKLPRD